MRERERKETKEMKRKYEEAESVSKQNESEVKNYAQRTVVGGYDYYIELSENLNNKYKYIVSQ